MGFDRFRYTRRASTAELSGTTGAREKSAHRLHYQYERATATVLADEIAGGRFQFFNCHFTRCHGRGCRPRRCTLSHVCVGRAKRKRLRCNDIEFSYHCHSRLYQFRINFHFQLGK